VAQMVAKELHWACAELVVTPSRQTAAKMASPDALQSDIKPSPNMAGDARALNLATNIPKGTRSDRP
jgi:hypothetical protein